MARSQGDPRRGQSIESSMMPGCTDVTFLDEEVKRMLIPFLHGEIVDNSKILVPSACKLQRSQYRGRTKKWLIH